MDVTVTARAHVHRISISLMQWLVVQVRGARYGSLEYVLRMELFKRSWANRAIIALTTACVGLTTAALLVLASSHLHQQASPQVCRTLNLLCITYTYVCMCSVLAVTISEAAGV